MENPYCDPEKKICDCEESEGCPYRREATENEVAIMDLNKRIAAIAAETLIKGFNRPMASNLIKGGTIK